MSDEVKSLDSSASLGADPLFLNKVVKSLRSEKSSSIQLPVDDPPVQPEIRTLRTDVEDSTVEDPLLSNRLAKSLGCRPIPAQPQQKRLRLPDLPAPKRKRLYSQ